MVDNRQALHEWGNDLERRILAIKSRGPQPVLASVADVPERTDGKRPHGFSFSWPPTANPKNRAWRRALRSLLVHRSWRAWATHKSESTGGCKECYAVEATQGGAEAPGFMHMYCHYCREGFLA